MPQFCLGDTQKSPTQVLWEKGLDLLLALLDLGRQEGVSIPVDVYGKGDDLDAVREPFPHTLCAGHRTIQAMQPNTIHGRGRATSCSRTMHESTCRSKVGVKT